MLLMKIENPEYCKEVKTAFRAGKEAAEVIDSIAENGFETENKKDGSKVTEADIEAQEKVVEVISERFPDDGFLGEEDGLSPSGENRVWVIDPIDGTFNFDHGFSHFCVSIALKIEGETVLGVVYSPDSSVVDNYLAVKGGGAYRTSEGIEEAERISVSGQSEVEDSIFFLSCFDIFEGELEAELNILEELAEEDGVHRQLGSCALEMCRVAAGEADFHIVPVVKEWDYAAAKLIIEEACGEVRTRDSKFPDCTEVVSSNGLLQERVEETVSDSFV